MSSIHDIVSDAIEARERLSARVTDIADALGVSRGTVWQHVFCTPDATPEQIMDGIKHEGRGELIPETTAA